MHISQNNCCGPNLSMHVKTEAQREHNWPTAKGLLHSVGHI